MFQIKNPVKIVCCIQDCDRWFLLTGLISCPPVILSDMLPPVNGYLRFNDEHQSIIRKDGLFAFLYDPSEKSNIPAYGSCRVHSRLGADGALMI